MVQDVPVLCSPHTQCTLHIRTNAQSRNRTNRVTIDNVTSHMLQRSNRQRSTALAERSVTVPAPELICVGRYE